MINLSLCDLDLITQPRVPGAVKPEGQPLDVRRADKLSALLKGDDLRSQLAAQLLEPLDLSLQLIRPPLECPDLAVHHLELLLELEHALYAGQIHPQLSGHLLNPPQPIDVLVRVEPGALGRAFWLDQAASLVHPQRLGMHFRKLGSHRDHEHTTLRGHLDAPADPRTGSPPASSRHQRS